MNYNFLNNSIEKDNLILPNSEKINPILLKNNNTEIMKALDFLDSDEKFLYVHGFMGTGKRQFVNYIADFLNKDVIKLEYYCKESTVCDDILLAFSDVLDNLSISKAVNLNAKITTLSIKFKQQISSIKKPFLIIFHSFDDILEENLNIIKSFLQDIIKEENIKLIVSAKGMNIPLLDELEEDRKIFLKALTKENFKEFLVSNQINTGEQTLEDFYKYTRGYYYYLALSIKIIQAMKVDLNEFLDKFTKSELSFDSFIGITYINLLPATIRNFFWFIRTIRHGLSFNALAVFELYDEFSINYLKENLMIFQDKETIYVQDYFLQKIDISIPKKTEIKLHKYIIGIYEEQLKCPVKNRVVQISRQAMRAEIEYHNDCIKNLEKNATDVQIKNDTTETPSLEPTETILETKENSTIGNLLQKAKTLANEKKFTDAIEAYKNITELENLDLISLVEARLNLARLYKAIDDNKMACHYYELVETYYKQHNELINLNYLYYELTEVYFNMYKNERAIETIKKVIYSVDTPQSLLVNASTLLGNIYSEINNPEEAFNYYKKALESLDGEVEDSILANLYFKYALANDDRGNFELAFEYYNKCISLNKDNPYKVLSYSNMASCYLDNENYDDAEFCFKKAYDIEKTNNNYEGIYYTSHQLAKIMLYKKDPTALDYLKEAKKSAEFINEDFYILEASLALGDYYYNNPDTAIEALKEYFNARSLAEHFDRDVDISKIEQRIKDMKLRMNPVDFNKIESSYAK